MTTDRTSHALIFAFSAETCSATGHLREKVACCDRKMTARAGSIRALRLLRNSALSATLTGLSRLRHLRCRNHQDAASPASNRS